ncbi:MAG: hypothetical protein QM793_05175 [Muricomes sp.]
MNRFCKSHSSVKAVRCFYCHCNGGERGDGVSPCPGAGAASGGELEILHLLKIGFSYLPAIWVMAGLAILIVGVIPKLSALVWLVFGYSFIVMYIGRVMDLPKWLGKITPFGNIPQIPVEKFSLTPLAVLTLIAIVLAAVGLWWYRERDIG